MSSGPKATGKQSVCQGATLRVQACEAENVSLSMGVGGKGGFRSRG